jgi:cell fate (sporulation/competence/biofilm development) regulator YlbF (YheA/YmcA/DUF963 family)
MTENNLQNQTSSFGITIEDIAKILNYPSLDKLFDDHNPNALADIRVKFNQTKQDLERVIRQGSKIDAEKADKTMQALNITLDFLADLEELKRQAA